MAYQKVNSYTHKVPYQMILSVALFFILVIIHSVFEVHPITIINHPILYTLLGLNYLLIVLMIFDFVRLTTYDPVDRMVVDPSFKKRYDSKDIFECDRCNSNVHVSSYHCRQCNRCTQGFDHHCKYLNNCIGKRNYEWFLRILVIITVFLINLIGQSLWIFLMTFDSPNVDQEVINKWVLVAIMGVSLFAIFAVDSLLCFHFYLNFWLKKTTFAWILDHTTTNQTARQSRQSHRTESQNRLDAMDA